MRLPIRPVDGRWPSWLQRRARRFFWTDPTVVLRDDAGPDEFRRAMSAINVGGTIKITGTNRHPRSDALLADNVDLTGRHVVDIGASDGSTSADLIERLDGFGRYTIADLYLHIDHRTIGRHHVFYDRDGAPILIVGPRLVAWPGLSAFVRTAYWRLLRRARQGGVAEPVLLLNPRVRNLMRSDARVAYREHDVFTPWPAEPMDAVKIANLLRRLYFSDARIRVALQAVIDSLPEGGHLLIVDNPRIEGIPERGGLYRRDGGSFRLVAQTEHTPEIADLIETTRAGDAG